MRNSPSERARRLASILLAHAGWRQERKNLNWLAAIAASLAIAFWISALDIPRVTMAYFVLVWVFYYVGNSLLLGTPLRARLIARLGEERAFLRYEMLVGLMFLNQGLALGAMASLTGSQWALPIPGAMAVPLGLALAALGLAIKVWATAAVGIDTYYFRDLFLGRPLGALVRSGPYRFLQHPMYGVGHLHAYGLALLSRSATGFVAAALCHLGILGFMLLVERPFLRRVHGAHTAALVTSPTPRSAP